MTPSLLNRREILRRSGTGLGMLGLADLLACRMVIWGGEFGRTPTVEGAGGDLTRLGRDYRLTDVEGKIIQGIIA